MAEAIPTPDDDLMTDRLLALLGDLAEIGLEVARAVERRAKAAGPDEDLNALAMAYSRIARAVRLTVMLQSRLIQERKAAHQSAAALQARHDPADVHKMRVERIVERLARQEHGHDEDEVDRLVAEAGEHLDDDDRLENIQDRPIGELVALICKDLGLSPDWARLAGEPWALAEIESGAAGSPFLPPPPQAAGGGPLAAERAVEGAGGSHNPRAPPCDTAL